MNTNQSFQVHQLKALVDQWRGSRVTIIKEEDGDLDQASIAVQRTSLKEREPTLDGYVSPLSLRLHGEGSVSAPNASAPLPYHIYDIPVEQVDECSFDGQQIRLQTDRGTYTISRV